MNKGFTLVELLIVIAIIAIFAALIFATIGGEFDNPARVCVGSKCATYDHYWQVNDNCVDLYTDREKVKRICGNYSLEELDSDAWSK